MTRRFLNFCDGLSRLSGVVSALLLLVAMLVVCQMVFLRYAFRAQTIWQTDFVVYTATAAIFLGAPYVLLKKGHVGVDVVESIAPPRMQRILALIGSLLGLAFCAAMLVASVLYVYDAWEGGWRASTVWAPRLWIAIFPVPVGFALLCLQYVAEIIKLRERAA